MQTSIIDNPSVKKVFDAYPEPLQSKLLSLRQLILEVASDLPDVGEIEETLKWGQPSYLTPVSKSGSTIRIDQHNPTSEQYAMYLNCQTTLIDTFRHLYPDEFLYEGNRAIVFDSDQQLPIEPLKHCIELALTYHRRKKRKTR